MLICCFFTHKLVAQVADAVEQVNKNAAALFRYFEKTGCGMTADGSEDGKVQPEHTKNYSFAGAPMPLGDDGKAEKKEEGEDNDSDNDEDSEADEYESDDEPDPETKVKSLADAVPAGWKVTAELPAMGTALVGKSVVFKWNVIGWANGVVSKLRRGRDARKYNFEIAYPPDIVYPHKLTHAGYSTNNAAPAGAWCVIVPR